MVNIQEFEAPDWPGDWNTAVKLMLKQQTALEEKYSQIEACNGFMLDMKMKSLDDIRVQDAIKHKAWCVVEELAEMHEAREDSESNTDHWEEEFADALHFYLAIGVITGYFPQGLCRTVKDEIGVITGYFPQGLCRTVKDESAVFSHRDITVNLGLMCNTLKNKRWKLDHKETNIHLFQQKYQDAGQSVMELWYALNPPFGPDNDPRQKLFGLYFRKSEVNKFRQGSGY